MSLFKKRLYYRPFEHAKYAELAKTQALVHWLEDEIPMNGDIKNWEQDLNEADKAVIGGILKMFTQMEVIVGDYWRHVASWFPKPEVVMMATTFSYFETIHQRSYALLNESLHLDNFEAFLQDQDCMAKVEKLFENIHEIQFTEEEIDIIESIKDTSAFNNLYYYNKPLLDKVVKIATSLAVFSAYTEGVQLFSSFAVLLSFKQLNLMKGVGKVVEFSIRDEAIHHIGGSMLFNQLCQEIPGLRDYVRKDILNAGKLVYSLETAYINSVFDKYSQIKTITKEQLLNFVKYRINITTKNIGYKEELFKVDQSLLEQVSWFDSLSSGQQFTDFFDTRPSDYTEVNMSADSLF
jgi:ribonucleoside-diphosphate reductase beta chain